MMRRGITNLLHHLNMLEGQPEIPAPPLRLQGIGNTDEGVVATAEGFWMPSVALLERVHIRQPLGDIGDNSGGIIATPIAPTDGLVALRRELPPVSIGDILILLATEE